MVDTTATDRLPSAHEGAPGRGAIAARPLSGMAGRRVGRLLLPFLVPLLILAVWDGVIRLGFVASYQLPTFAAVIRDLTRLAASGELLRHLGISSQRLLIGFLCGAGAATLVGAASGYVALFRVALDPTLQALRSIPAIAWVPLFLLWLGIGETSKVALIAFGVFFPVYLNFMSSLLKVDRKLVEVGRVNRMSGARLIWSVLLPASLPGYLVGLRTGLGLGWMFVVAAELMGASSGIGFLLLDGQTSGRPGRIVGAMLIFALVGKATDFVVATASQRLLRWQDVVGG